MNLLSKQNDKIILTVHSMKSKESKEQGFMGFIYNLLIKTLYVVVHKGFLNYILFINLIILDLFVLFERNTGFPKIARALKNNGSPEAEYITDPERISFLSVIHCHPDFIESGVESSTSQNIAKDEQVSEQVPIII